MTLKTYNDLYLDLRRELLQSGVEAATLEAREIVAFASGKSKERLLADARLYAPERVTQTVEELKARRLSGEPLAYLIGEWSFCGLDFDVNEAVLIPRTDTELLAEEAIAYVRTLGKCRVLDMCSGSGCIGIALAHHCPDASVTCAELSEAAQHVIWQNVRRHGLMGRVLCISADVRREPEFNWGHYDCIVCNPPYIPTRDIEGLDASVRDYEPHLALDGGADGLDFYRHIAGKWSGLLKEKGRIFLEVGIGQADDVMRILEDAGYGDLELKKDTGGVFRVISGRFHSSFEQNKNEDHTEKEQ